MSDFMNIPPAARVGRLLDLLGQIGLPLGVGAVGGFWAADLGMQWLPDMLELFLAVSVLSLLLIAVGRALQGKAWEQTPAGTRVRKRVAVALGLAGLGCGVALWLHEATEPSALTELEPAAFHEAWTLDLARYEALDATLEVTLSRLERHPELLAGEKGVLSADTEALLTDSWAVIYDTAFTLDQIRIFYENWWRFDPSRADRSRHVRSFLLTYAAELSLYEKSARLSALILRNKDAKNFLDAPHLAHDLPADTFSQFRSELQGTRDQSRVVAGERYTEFLETGLGARVEHGGVLWRRIEGHLAAIDAVAPIDRAAFTVRGDAQILKRALRRAWFPTRKKVAETMGDIRLRRIGWYLITHEQLEEMDTHLRPGDILLGRKNWYLSNAGLPGFWPHAILYIGAPTKLVADMDDPDVRDWILEETGEAMDFEAYVSSIAPEGWRRYRLGDAGIPIRVIEAVGEGVLLHSLDKAAGDYLSALRPRVSKVVRARAIAQAFASLGRPYDWDFDFATDHALVCSEVIWRSYRPLEGEGLTMPLQTIAGRQTLPPTGFAELYVAEREEDDRRLDFVYFLDAIEDEQRAFVSDEAAFVETPGRSRWDFARP